MTAPEPPLEAHRYGRSQTPESPRPLHIPEPSSIPVLQNQMDPFFNDTATYDLRQQTQHLPSTSEHAQAYEASFKGQAEGGLNNSNGQQGLAATTYNAGAVGNPEGMGPIMSSNELSENKSMSQFTSDTSATSNGHATTQSHLSSLRHSINSQPLPLNDRLNLSQNSTAGNAQATKDPANRDFQLGSSPIQTSSDSLSATIVKVNQSNDLRSGAGPQSRIPADEGVNYQSLLENLSRASSIAPIPEGVTAPTAAEPNDGTGPSPSATSQGLPVGIGLPPRPPAQDKPSMHPNYPANEDIRSYHHFPSPNNNPSYPIQNPPYGQDAGMAPVNVAPVPAALKSANTFPLQDQQPNAITQLSPISRTRGEGDASASVVQSGQGGEEDRPWASETQTKYDQFLHDERIYVTEGTWDRFPPGSRLFVGNLATEKVTKRDLFHVFHKHGKLAQLSINQAYGFVQYMDAAAASDALREEQSVEIRGKKMHLEISKPQKQSRGAGAGDRNVGSRRRSRSPDRRGGARSGGDRFERPAYPERPPFSDFRDEPLRRRDDYRPGRSPSPHGFRSRDEYRARDRSPSAYSRWDGKPRSPGFGRESGAHPSSPKGYDDDATLPLPRRHPREVPDVQILILEEVAQDFLSYIEQGFRSKALRVETILLNPRITLAAVVKRQIIEGVQAVVKLTRNSQYAGKVPLQVFDRAGGGTSVNFNEYVELDVQVAADIVISARQKERLMAHHSTAPYPSSHGYGTPLQQMQYPQPQPALQQFQQPQQQPYGQPQITPGGQTYPAPNTPYRSPPPAAQNVNPGAPNLQELLANLRQPPSQAPLPNLSPQQPQNAQPTDLAGLLSNVARQSSHAQNYSRPGSQQAMDGQYPGRPPQQPYTNQIGIPGYSGATSQPPQQNVQNIMEQLARWNK